MLRCDLTRGERASRGRRDDRIDAAVRHSTPVHHQPSAFDPGPIGAYRFGVFELDGREGELRKQGRLIRLRGQPLQILLALIERPGVVVTREELRQRLWPDNTFVEFDHSLNTAIKRLRETLGDTASTPRFVETIPRQGYRFAASVEAILVTPSTEDSLAPPAPSMTFHAVGHAADHAAGHAAEASAIARGESRVRHRGVMIAAATLVIAIAAG